MNERIKELLEQATNSIKDEYGHWIGSELDEEKFAELIIKECAQVASDYDGAHYVGSAIEKHFGVEE